MPEFSEEFEINDSENGDIVDLFEQFLDSQPKITITDLDNIEMVIFIRLRSLLTVDQLHHRAHAIIQGAEALLRTPGALTDQDTGEPVEPTLVENFPGGAQEVIAMAAGMDISDEDIEEFLSQYENEGEEE